LALFAILMLQCSGGDQQAENYKYPLAMRVDVVDNYHGTDVADPYRWLENPNSEETKAWVTAQNELTAEFVNTPARDKVKDRLTELWDYPKYGSPYKEGNRYFYWKNDGLQNQDVLYMINSLTDKPVMVLDPNAMSEDGTVSVDLKDFSTDGKYLVYAVKVSGSDEEVLKIRDIDSGRDLDESIEFTKFSGVSWKHDNSGFFYDRYPDPSTVPPEDVNKFNKVYFHKLGTPQSNDELTFEMPSDKDLGFAPEVTDDGHYLVLHVWHGTDNENRIYYRRIGDEGEFIRLLDKADASYQFINNIGTDFYFNTDLDAPMNRVVKIDIKNPARENWVDVIPEQENAIESVHMIDKKLVAVYLEDAHDMLKIFDLDGKVIAEPELPAIGSVHSLKGKRDHKEMFFKFSSFLYPSYVYRYDFKDSEMCLFRKTEVDFEPDDFVTRQVFATSKDGTKVPLFITHKEDLPLDGNNPALLYGYGGFNSNTTPYFSTQRIIWMENGGIYAQASLRGGREYGEKWHRAGMLENKQNVFDDFIACGEWLIENNYTDSSLLAIDGGSNGGLLVAAVMVQRPDLFGAVLCRVPVIDMLRYHMFTVGHFWTGEYGNAEENPEHFAFMYAYSPLHNIESGQTYPATLITTADTDDRVVPMHGKKFAAALQYADSGENPILLRVDTKAG
ncbi:MAG: S9 family peptidase, partial [candidate division Zixibacteria bacterium]|nr:S9 family peptidase [candidate division Zixibacteria bacterium]NIT51704.1 S9 family peptidase [candidate division Zixibacteria bacterium]NIW39573.1 prolyl oligopeptidase family serine peptidase [candidate division Zixibacteria bacterium]NIX57502.1 prolyl oligopeptidase family serine peptidase [candidate division Zixibacteria bacterium]